MPDVIVERAVTLRGRRYTYRDSGRVAVPTVVALHGLTSHAGVWDAFALALGDGVRVLAPDLRGHGGSDHSPDYRQQAWVDDLADFADALALERFALVGMTMGGRIAWLYASVLPARVSRVVSIDMAPRLPGSFKPIGDPSFADVDEAVAAARTEQMYAPSRDDLFRAFVQRNLRRADGRWVWRYDPALRAAPAEHPGFSATVEEQWAAIRAIACPTLVVSTGWHAAIAADIRELMVPALRDGRLLELPRGEDLLLGRPDALARAVRAFLSTGGAP